MIQALRELIQAYVKELVLRDVEITDANGDEFTYPKAVQFLKRGYDRIFMNLGLPDELAIRTAELAHLSGAPTRIFVTSGWPAEFGPKVELFDQFITVPMVESQFVGRLHKILIADPRQLRRRLPTREHLDAAIIGILQRVRVGKENLDEALKFFAD